MNDLPPQSGSIPVRLANTVEAGGCSAKLGPKQLGEILAQVPLMQHADIIVGAESHDDAGVLRLADGQYLIATTDFFPPMVDDPYEFGQVAAANALSDVYAMGGKPLYALSLVMFPSKQFDDEVLVAMLKGGADKAREAGCLILGGHTIDDAPIKYGLAITGIVTPELLVTNAGARPGDVLVLTKPLGTSILAGARKADLIDEAGMHPAIVSMTTLNDIGARHMNRVAAHGATDITGFGLLGHAFRFADASKVTFRIESSRLPVLPGALDLVSMGVIPGGCMRNLEFIREHTVFLPSLTAERKWLCLDPQTSGGLLIAVAPDRADTLVAGLKNDGMLESRIVGEVHPPGEKRLLLA